MLKKHGQIFQAILFLSDMGIIVLAWLAAYYFRFFIDFIPALKGVPEVGKFIKLLVFLLPVHAVVFRYVGLYEPMRSSARALEFRKIVAASGLSLLMFTTVVYAVSEYRYSRGVFLFFFLLAVIFLSLFRISLRLLFGWLRSHGYNLRYTLIVGDGRLAREVESRLIEHAEYGFKVIGLLSREESSVGKVSAGAGVIASYKQIKEVLAKTRADQVIIALPFEQVRLLKPLLGKLSDEMVEVKIVPDLYEYFTLRQGIEVLGGLPIINLRESPLYGINTLLKRFFDLIVAIVILYLMLPLLAIIFVLVKLSSSGPALYRQQRMGLDGRVFKILKFRSMEVEAEKDSGPVWAEEFDARRTKIGKFLRCYNLDELPQFLNVLKGEMSIVGPRPERPEFMQGFKRRIPEYMLRHKVKAGITGWAQVNGLRGNTSLEERTSYDLYYIQHWSFLFDLKIFFRSFFATKNAY